MIRFAANCAAACLPWTGALLATVLLPLVSTAQDGTRISPPGDEWIQRYGFVAALGEGTAVVTSDVGAHVYRREGASWVSEAELPLGIVVAVDGNLIAGRGRVRDAVDLFRFDGDDWQLESRLGPRETDFGTEVAVNGDVIVVGNPFDDTAGSRAGSAVVFRHIDGVWTEEARLVAADATANARLGATVALDSGGEVAVVGSHEIQAAYVFRRTNGQWIEEEKLLPPSDSFPDFFAREVAVSGDVVTISGRMEPPDARGVVYVYRFRDSGWTLAQTLVDSLGFSGDEFGVSVAIERSVLVVGNPNRLRYYYDTGGVHLFEYDGARWVEDLRLYESHEEEIVLFGWSVGIRDREVIVSALGASAAYSYDVSRFVGESSRELDAVELLGNYPNPFHEQTVIRLALTDPADVAVRLYDVRGRQIRDVLSTRLSAGEHAIPVYVNDGAMPSLSSGLYFYRVTSGAYSETGSFVVVR